MSEGLSISVVRAEVEEEAIAVEIELINDLDRTIYVYRRPRRMLYDAATKTLEVGLTDRGTDPGSAAASSFVLPELVSVDAHSSRRIELRLPHFLTRLGGVTAQGAPIVERVPIHEASEIALELGWSDTPFYRDPRKVPREPMHPAAQLRRWERGVVQERVPVGRATSA